MRHLGTIVATATLALLAGCGPGKEASPAGETSSGGSASVATSGGGWTGLDACSAVDHDKLGQAVGGKVVSAKLLSKSPGGGAVFSTCGFTLADGRILTLLTRVSPVGDATPEAIEMARTMGGNMPPATDVDGVGAHALWTAQVRTLQVFFDQTRYASISIAGPGAVPSALEDAKRVAGLL
ncbi:MAG: hypothetical protein KF842_10045 [Caulobacter sp.]|nr:hypothetical protein [Caulobacter sp.]